MSYTILIVSYDIREWQPASLIDYPRRAVLVGRLSEISPLPDSFDNVDDAVEMMTNINKVNIDALPIMLMMFGMGRWAVALPESEANEVLAIERGEWFSMTYAEEVNARVLKRVEHMAAPEYHDKFSVN